MRAPTWTDVQKREALRLASEGVDWAEIGDQVGGVSADAARHRIRRLQGTRQEGATADPEPVAPDEHPAIVDRDAEHVGGRAAPAVFTVAVGDTQHGEREFCLRSWAEVCARLVERAREIAPAQIKVILTGDVVTGASVFRGQSYAVALPNTSAQVLYSATTYHEDLLGPLAEVAPLAGVVVDGNHDANGVDLNLTAQWCDVLGKLGSRVVYAGQRAAVNLAPVGAPRYLAGVEHGFGGSSYYANGYSHQRAVAAGAIQAAILQRYDGEMLRRVISGHTHWLNISQDVLGSGLKLDTVGGWTRPERYKLGGAARPIGAIAYIHSGERLTIEAVRPSDATLRSDIEDTVLHYRNLRHAADAMMRATERLVAAGLVASIGEVL